MLMKTKFVQKALSLVVACLMFMVPAFAQSTVTGSVHDAESGLGIPGASIFVKGTTTGTQTDGDGNFSIQATSSSVLTITAVGYASQEITVGNQTSITVNLVPSSGESLDEVVVVGYGTSRKSDLTGAVASVRAKDFNKGVVASPDQLIQGKVAGVQITNNSGAPGSAATIRIRGISSIRSGNAPLFVIDGVPLAGSAIPSLNTAMGDAPGQNPLNFINPNDIVSIDVLKDASATAIFGSRGANGVVMITTKKGSTGMPSLELGTSVAFSSPMKRYDVMTAAQYREALNVYDLTTGDLGADVDAFQEILNTGKPTWNHNVAMSGGTDNGRYRLSLGYMDQKGLLKESSLKKYTASLNSSFKFTESKRLGFDFNLMASNTQLQTPPISNNAGYQGTLVGAALMWNPTAPLTWSPEKPLIDNYGSTTAINPLALLGAWDDRDNITNLLASLTPYFKITDDLEYRLVLSANYVNGQRRSEIRNWINFDNVVGRGWAGIFTQYAMNTQLTHTLNYQNDITDAVNLNALVGYEFLDNKSWGNGQNARRFVDYPNLRYTDYIGNAPAAESSQWSWRNPTQQLQSLFARVGLNIADKYLLTGTVRRDGSTKFGENNKYGIFPSVAAAWNISNEDFMQGSSLFNNLKIRGSWGKTGNQEFPSGASLLRVSIGTLEATTPNTYPNPDLKWETNTMANIGADFGLLNNRVNGSFDFFTRTTVDALFQQAPVLPGPPSGTFWINLPGEINNSGFEFALNFGVIRNERVNWNIGGNAAFLKNEISGLPGAYETGGIHGQGVSGATVQRLVSGQPMNVFYLRDYLGIDKATGQSMYTDDGNTLFYFGSPNPKYVYGLSTDVSVGNLSLVVNLNGAAGHYIYNNTLNATLPIGNLRTRNLPYSLINTDALESLSNAVTPSTRYLEKGDYLKLANATLSYRLGNIVNDLFKNAVVSLTGQNLFVFTGFTGFDPEVNVDKSVNGIPSQGIEYIPYPTPRNIILSLNFGL